MKTNESTPKTKTWTREEIRYDDSKFSTTKDGKYLYSNAIQKRWLKEEFISKDDLKKAIDEVIKDLVEMSKLPSHIVSSREFTDLRLRIGELKRLKEKLGIE